MRMSKRPALILLLTLLLLSFAAYAVDDSTLELYDEAIFFAQVTEPPAGLSAAEAEIWRQGFAAGYCAVFDPRDAQDEYVLNTSTQKFHFLPCHAARSIAPDNRLLYHGTRDDLIADGFEPCGICKP